nr:DNA internalization-related competence protein ComEC/Rec2 [uncultured Anaerobutyricum sp.]
MKRPVFLLFMGLVLGEAAAIFSNRNGFFVMALFLLIFIIIIYKIIKKKRSHFFIYSLLFLCMFFVGELSFYRAKYLDKLDRCLLQTELEGTLTGQVEFIRKTPTQEYQITLKKASFLKKGNEAYLKNGKQESQKNTKITIKKSLNKEYHMREKCRILKIPVSEGKIYPGDWILCTGRLGEIEKPTNPGQFNSRIYYYSLGIRYQFFGEKIVRKRESPLSFGRMADLVKKRIEEVYRQVLSEEDYGVLKAMFLGDKMDLSKEQKTLYQESGTAHLLAVSGLHVSIVGGILFRLLRKKGYSYTFSCLVGSMVLLFYAVMTGAGNSVFRAAIMFLCYMLSQYVGAEYDLVSSMSLAGILMLLECPWRLLESGCILSFVSVFVIGMFLPFARELEERRGKKKLSAGEFSIESKWKKRVRQAFFANLILSMTITPLILRFYYQWSPYSVLLNLFVIPAMSPLLLSAIAGGVLGIFSWIAGFLGCIPAMVLLRSFTLLFHLVSKIPGSVIVTGCLPWWKIFLIYLLELCFFLFWYYRLWSGSIILSLFLVAGTFFHPVPSLKVIMFDVGQGECIFIKMPFGDNILIDGGSTSKKNIADSIIVPALKYYGTDHLDYVIITHTDEDHISGIRELLEQKYPIRNIVLPDTKTIRKEELSVEKKEAILSRKQSEETTNKQDFQNQQIETSYNLVSDVREKGYSILKTSTGDQFKFDRIRMYCLHPQKGWAEEDVNSGSLVFYLMYGKFTMLFTGDLNGEQEPLLNMTGNIAGQKLEAILKNGKVSTISIRDSLTVLKTAHHGSKNSTTASFLKKFHPKKAILSAGKNNLYGHPHKETLKRLKKRGTDVYGTLWGGAIVIESDGQQYSINYFKEK